MAAHADQYDDFAVISSTLGVQDGRVCVGEASRGDIGCPTYAPYVASDGSISATRFVGDGSGLFNIAGASADRIVSGTTSMLAISNTGYISITQSGYNTAYFHPTLGLVAVGISTTGRISTTDLAVRGSIDIVSGTGSLLIGQGSGANMTNYNYNTALGGYAGQYNTQDRSVFVGYTAGQYNTGRYVVLAGRLAGQYNSSSYVTGVGSFALQYNSGSEVTGIGTNALISNTGRYVTGVGMSAAQSNSGSNVTALGTYAAATNNGSKVTAVGHAAAMLNVGSENVAIGMNAARANNASSVTALGYNAAANNTYSNITALGYNAQPDKANQVVLGDGNVVEVSTSGVILAAGLGIGVTAPAANLEVSGTISATAIQVAAILPDSACAGPSDLGKMRRNPTTGRMQLCR